MKNEEYAEMRVINGKHFLFYNGVKIPMQLSSIVLQDVDDNNIAKARITLLVKLKESHNEKRF